MVVKAFSKPESLPVSKALPELMTPDPDKCGNQENWNEAFGSLPDFLSSTLKRIEAGVVFATLIPHRMVQSTPTPPPCPFEKRFPSQLVRDDRLFMSLAYNQAIDGWRQDEVPVGAVIVIGDEVVASAHNTVEGSADPTAHAEMLALTQAAAKFGDWRLEGATVYVTKEPCPMCSGAMLMSRVKRV